MGITTKLVVGAAVVAAIGAGAQMKLTGTPSEAPPTNKVGTAEYTVTLPADWTEQGSKTDGAGRVDRYGDADGNYVKVRVFKAGTAFGSGYAADTTWLLTVNTAADGFTIAKKDPTCVPGVLTPDCSAGNGKLEIYAMVRGGDVAVRGTVLQFEVGNDRAETGVDTTVFEEIIEGLHIN